MTKPKDHHRPKVIICIHACLNTYQHFFIAQWVKLCYRENLKGDKSKNNVFSSHLPSIIRLLSRLTQLVFAMEETDNFLADGYERLRGEHEPEIRAEVERKYAHQIASASWLNRRRIRKQIEREIETKLDDLAPPDALY